MDSNQEFINEDLNGQLSVKLKNGKTIQQFCTEHIPEYNPDRLEVLAIRFYYGLENYVTLYAIDKQRQEGSNFTENKIPVKKIKLNGNFLQELLPFIDEYNFTLSTGNYPIEHMEIINK